MNRFLICISCLFALLSQAYAQQQGDTVNIGNTKYVLSSGNLISNPGFEDGFTGWTDATSSAAQLSSSYFSIIEPGGIDDSRYLVGTTNSSKTSAGSIGTGWSIEPGKTYYFSYNVKYLNTSTIAGPEVWLKVSLTNDKTNSEEPYILIDTTWVNGGGEWTRNAVGFTNANPSYYYIVARFRWLSNRFGFDNFALHEAHEIVDHTGLQAVINEAEQLYDETAKGAAELQDAINTAQSLLSSNSAEEIRQGIVDLERAILDYKILNASADNPLDLTNLIVNPGFEAYFDAWINDGMATQTNTVFTGKEGNVYVEKWVNRGTYVPDVSVQQLVTGIPNGKYLLTAATGNIQQTESGSTVNNSENPQTGAFLFAGQSETAVDTIKDRSICFDVYDNQVNIGLRTENATGNWVTCDNFRLHYMGFDLEEMKDYLQMQVDTARTLLESKMQDTVRSVLTIVIDSAEQVLLDQEVTQEILANTILLMQNSIIDAKHSVYAYIELQDLIDKATALYGSGDGNDADILKIAIDSAIEMSNNYKAGIEDINKAVSELNRAILAYNLANTSGEAPDVTTNPDFARGATMVFGRSTISGISVASLLEHGFCWSTNPEPTILDNRITKYYSKNGNLYCIENLKPSTVYYLRAYAMTQDYAVGYGEVIKVITIPKGTVTYTLSSNVTGDHRIRIDDAMASAVDYYNNLTSIQGHWLNVNYGSGTPTAEASYGGYMRFGPNPAYQRTGTALHEMGHTIGVGTHSMWYGPSSPLRETGSRGAWLGDRTKKVLQFIDNDASSYLRGDHIHMWPYGINGAHEDDGTELLYITNALITQALGEDGLPPTGGFATPAYTFEIEDSTKYFIKNEDEQSGLFSSFVVPDQAGNLVNRIMTPHQAIANDSAAWQLEFNPLNCYYTLSNVATGMYFTYKTTGYNGIRMIEKQNLSSAEYFQLMRGRVEANIESLTKKGYWIIHPEAKSSPSCFTASTGERTLTSSFNISNASAKQRWLFLSDDEVNKLDTVTVGYKPKDQVKSSSNVWIYAKNNQVHVENIASPSDILIYNISGVLLLKANNIAASFSHSLSGGFYIIVVRSGSNQEVKKIVMQ